MKDYILNPDTEYVKKIIEGIQRKNGYCPCRLYMDETTLCPCNDFVQNGNCKCKLFIKKV